MGRSWMIAGLAFIAGTALSMFINVAIGPAVLGLFFLVVGLLLHALPGTQDPYARRAFVLSFSICVLVLGVAQCYATVMFDEIQTTTDSHTFYNLVVSNSSEDGLEDLRSVVNAPLPVITWRIFYTILAPLGDAPYIGILLNSFLVGMTGSVTIRGAKHIAGIDPRILCRLGTLFAACGMFWLFGAIFIRDSFALLLNVVVLWACLKALSLPNLKNLIVLAAAVAAAAICMNYIREGASLLFVAVLLLALFCWTRRYKGSVLTIMFPIVIVLLAILLQSALGLYSAEVTTAVQSGATSSGSQTQDVGNSLGAAMVVTQPMPIRIPLGFVYLFIQPIPLWNNFRFFMIEYHWIKGWQGLFMAGIVPSFVVGFFISARQGMRGGHAAPPLSFLALYALITTMAVAATSLETRHHGQFIPAILILASIPNKLDPSTAKLIRTVAIIWFGFVICGHILWALIKFT